MSRRKPITCECGNTEDLTLICGEILCKECRICPHGIYYITDTIAQPYYTRPEYYVMEFDNFICCRICYTRLFFIETFVGLCLVLDEARDRFVAAKALPFLPHRKKLL